MRVHGCVHRDLLVVGGVPVDGLQYERAAQVQFEGDQQNSDRISPQRVPHGASRRSKPRPGGRTCQTKSRSRAQSRTRTSVRESIQSGRGRGSGSGGGGGASASSAGVHPTVRLILCALVQLKSTGAAGTLPIFPLQMAAEALVEALVELVELVELWVTAGRNNEVPNEKIKHENETNQRI